MADKNKIYVLCNSHDRTKRPGREWMVFLKCVELDKKFRFTPENARFVWPCFAHHVGRKVWIHHFSVLAWPTPTLYSLIDLRLIGRAMANIRVLRDIKARHGVAANEITRRAYLYIARNETLPPQVRHQAQLQLNSFDRYTRPTTVKNRCAESGKGRGIMSEFALSRVSPKWLLMSRFNVWSRIQFQFRMKALRGELNGVHKASW